MKQLTGDNYLIRPFVTHKTQDYAYTFLGGSNPEKLSIDIATDPSSVSSNWVWAPDNEPQNMDGLYEHTLYLSVQHLFYNTTITPTTASAQALGFSPTGSQFYVVNISQLAYGEGIRPSSVRITSVSSTASLYDDGRGRIVSSVSPTRVIGNVFYGLGLIVLEQCSAPFTASVVSSVGVFFTTGSQVNVEFDATHTIYEHQVVCTMEPNEFNYSINPSIRRDGTRVILDQFVSGTLTPYMTSVGLFNDAGEMVAVAKFPNSLKRATDTQQTIVVRWDI
jgi:hypothetical protein